MTPRATPAIGQGVLAFSLRSFIGRAILLVALLATLSLGAGAQSKQQPNTPEARVEAMVSSDPLLMSRAKQIASDLLNSRGQNVNVESISDSELLRWLRTDPDLAFALNREFATLEENATRSAGSLRTLLQQNPSLMAKAKRVVLQVFESRGQRRTSEDITDAELLRLASEDQAISLALEHEFREFLNPGGDQEADEEAEQITSKRTPVEQDFIRRRSPYSDISALGDLYKQVPFNDGKLQRFGASFFASDPKSKKRNTSDRYSADERELIGVPAGSDYVLGPGDVLTISVAGGVPLRLARTVDAEGRLDLPDAGTVLIVGKSIAAAETAVAEALRKEFRNPAVSISLNRMRVVRVNVVGDVRHPGPYTAVGSADALSILTFAGGPTENGSLRKIRHFRGIRLLEEIDLYQFLLNGNSPMFQPFANGDTLLVMPIGDQVSVSGEVKRPAIYELKNEKTIAEVLQLAGGLTTAASLDNVTLDRIEAHQKRSTISLRGASSNGTNSYLSFKNSGEDTPPSVAAIDDAFSTFRIQDGDRVNISTVLPSRQKTVLLQGHVYRPGPKGYVEGMTLTDVLSADDLLPEPASKAEIIRLKPPQFRPTVLSFPLIEAVQGKTKINLEPFDTVRIYGRYERDFPKVSIQGEIVRPGTFPLGEGMRVSELVKLAGGPKRSAYLAVADLTSYSVENGTQVSPERREIALEDALNGSLNDDPVLKPGDVVGIRQVSGWSDIGSVVTIRGQVRFPGVFGIERGERLSSVIARAGGFTAEAYPYGAVLERIEIGRMAAETRADLARKLRSESLSPSGATVEEMAQFRQLQKQVLEDLETEPASGRLVVSISSSIDEWRNTSADAILQAGDEITIPKNKQFVMVNGQVYNPSAIAFEKGRTAGWYLSAAGGSTRMANDKDIYIIRANGLVIAPKKGFLGGGVLNTRMRPGDTVVVPQKINVGSSGWRAVAQSSQIISALAIAARAVAGF